MFNQINKNVVTILGIDTLPIGEQKGEMERLGTIVYGEVIERTLDILTEEDKDEFEKLIDINEDPEKMFEFLSDKIPDLEEIVKEEAEKLREENINIMDKIGK